MKRAVSDPAYPSNASPLGNCIPKARMDAGLRIQQLAGVHEMTIVNLEQGRARPTPEKLTALTTALMNRGSCDLAAAGFLTWHDALANGLAEGTPIAVQDRKAGLPSSGLFDS